VNPHLLPAQLDGDVPAWTQTVVAFLAEKERRSGSRRTVEGYSRMLWPFLSRIGSPDRVTPGHVLAWAHGVGASGREPSSATVGARIACLSSYFRFLIPMQIATSNPCDALERPKTVPPLARGLTAEQIRQLLAVVPDTVAGRRDRALLVTFILTGRRRSEVIGLKAGDITLEGETVFYSYRGKGGKRGPARAATAGPRGATQHPGGYWAGPTFNGCNGVSLAGRCWSKWRHGLDFLQPLPTLSPGGRPGASRAPHPSP
jgi:site-specific recombinase XerC